MNIIKYLIEKKHQIDEYCKTPYEQTRIEILKFAVNAFSKDLCIRDLQILSDDELINADIGFWYGYYMFFPFWITACLKSDEIILVYTPNKEKLPVYTYKEQLSTVEEYIEGFLEGEITDMYPGYRMLNKFEKWLLTS